MRIPHPRIAVSAIAALAATLAVVIFLTAGSTAATTHGRRSTSTPLAGRTVKLRNSAKLSACLGAHGITALGLRGAAGGVSVKLRPVGAPRPKSITPIRLAARPVLAQQSVCGGVGRWRVSRIVASLRARAVKLVQCMRSHGVTDFPLPPAVGMIPQVPLRAVKVGRLAPGNLVVKGVPGLLALQGHGRGPNQVRILRGPNQVRILRGAKVRILRGTQVRILRGQIARSLKPGKLANAARVQVRLRAVSAKAMMRAHAACGGGPFTVAVPGPARLQTVPTAPSRQPRAHPDTPRGGPNH